jgi:hypothetical protein
LVFSELPVTTDIEAAGSAPEQVLDRCLVKKGNAAVQQVLVKWARMPEASMCCEHASPTLLPGVNWSSRIFSWGSCQDHAINTIRRTTLPDYVFAWE